MWNFLKGMLIVGATGAARPLRLALFLILMGCAIAGLIYAVVVFNAVRGTPESHHVQQHSND